jgi:hypothetical protein
MYFDGQMCQKTMEMVGASRKAWEELTSIKTDITADEIDAWKKDGRK